MKQLVHLKSTITPSARGAMRCPPLGRVFLVVPLLLACFAIAAVAYAVTPAPDGGYPGSNTAEGTNALFFLTTGVANTALGFTALRDDNTGSFNTAVGSGALLDNTSGSRNTAVGGSALVSNATGDFNTAVGQFALGGNFMGNYNTAVGHRAGFNVTGSGNVYIGAGVSAVAGESNTTRIRNVYSSVASARAVYVNSDSKLGALPSSRRYKDESKPMDKASELLFALEPVTFRYKKEVDPARVLSFGLIAEDVAKVSPDLITCDEEGNPESVRYDAVNAMLLNEFLKEHRKVEQMQKQIDALTAGFQKVSAQLELSKAEPQTVVNNR